MDMAKGNAQRKHNAISRQGPRRIVHHDQTCSWLVWHMAQATQDSKSAPDLQAKSTAPFLLTRATKHPVLLRGERGVFLILCEAGRYHVWTMHGTGQKRVSTFLCFLFSLVLNPLPAFPGFQQVPLAVELANNGKNHIKGRRGGR